jgi:hypothetical protein
LLQRLHNGGENMPPFPHLSEAEIAALVAYLNQLAEVPGAKQKQATVKEPAMRVGEHIVKSTCHDAAGPNPTAQQLEDGAIPPLETLATRVGQSEFAYAAPGPDAGFLLPEPRRSGRCVPVPNAVSAIAIGKLRVRRFGSARSDKRWWTAFHAG